MRSFILVFLLFFTSFDGVKADEIRAVTEILAPYQTLNKDNEIAGFGVEVVKAIGREAGDNISIDAMAWERAYRIASTQEDVLIFSIFRNPAREKHFHWIGELDENNHYFYALKGTAGAKITDEESAKSAIVGVEENSFEDVNLEKRGYINLMQVSQAEHLVNMLHLKRIDLLFGSEVTIANLVKQANKSPDDFVRLFHMPNWGDGLYLAFSKNTAKEKVKRYRKAFKTLRANGTIAKLKEKHFKYPFIK